MTYDVFIFDSPQPILDALEHVFPSQHDAHVGVYRLFQRIGGYDRYSADFERRRGYSYRSVQLRDCQSKMMEVA